MGQLLLDTELVFGPIVKALRGPTRQGLLGLVSVNFDVFRLSFLNFDVFSLSFFNLLVNFDVFRLSFWMCQSDWRTLEETHRPTSHILFKRCEQIKKCRQHSDLTFVKKITQPDFRAKNFTH